MSEAESSVSAAEKVLKRERKHQRKLEKAAKRERKENRRLAKEQKRSKQEEVKLETQTETTQRSDAPPTPIVGQKRRHNETVDAEEAHSAASLTDTVKTCQATNTSTDTDERRRKLQLCVKKYCRKIALAQDDLAVALHETPWEFLPFAKFVQPYFRSTPTSRLEFLCKELLPKPIVPAKKRNKSSKASKSASTAADSSNEFAQPKKNPTNSARETARANAAAKSRAIGRSRRSHDTPIDRIYRTFTISEHAMAMEERWREHALTEPVYRTGKLTADEAKIISDAVFAYCIEREINEAEFSELLWNQSGMSKAEKVQLNSEFVHLLVDRKPKNVYMYLRRRYSIFEDRTKFTPEEDRTLLQLQEELGNDWREIGLRMKRNNQDVRDRYRMALGPPEEKQSNKKPWEAAEDAKLREAVGSKERPDWAKIATTMAPRSRNQCEARYARLALAGIPRRVRENQDAQADAREDSAAFFAGIAQYAYAKKFKVPLADVCIMLNAIQESQPMPSSLSEAIQLPALNAFTQVFQISEIIQRLQSVLPVGEMPFERKVQIALAWLGSLPEEELRQSEANFVDSDVEDL
ncbi:hypothetical protein BCR37DRAFT_394270 [Protomyces lactucae-debilis]|uniref:Homeodomain-like protein n=1 Tax=Protomyces lactucae-debilis TaxID=2754530 RepID=A0A1Y2F6L0_PROLT|nr:uncharacterized protein BCR37DRAFT_394270 [Protomyces lactucae-debilis]ORY79550.1 hypothetical protein BCR37DRAFT_394270 [Protomyces lactucae-debilis]